jgi:hypothetical protein
MTQSWWNKIKESQTHDEDYGKNSLQYEVPVS